MEERYLALYEYGWRIFLADNFNAAWVNAQKGASNSSKLLDCGVYTGRVGVQA